MPEESLRMSDKLQFVDFLVIVEITKYAKSRTGILFPPGLILEDRDKLKFIGHLRERARRREVNVLRGVGD